MNKKNLIAKKFSFNSDFIEHGGKRVFDKEKERKKHPLITIITVVKNNEKFLTETFDSIFNQTFKDFEYIVVDGASVDKTINIIKNYEKKIDYWVSKKDNGIYHAFNTGLELARGKLIGFVNSDDVLRPRALEILFNYYQKYPKKDFFFGSVKKHWGIIHGYNPKKILWSWGFYTSHSTGFYIKKNAAQLIGYYNTKYKYHADYEYFFRVIVKNKMLGIASSKYEVFGDFRRGGFSSKIPYVKRFFEEIKIRFDHRQNIFLIIFLIIYKFIKNFKEFLK
jgi:glycosyltransferase involved in cell wall biosynthesis